MQMIFFDSDDEENNNSPIDIAEIPPERVNELSDNEDIDDDILDDEEPSDVPGMIEIHRSATEDRVVVLNPSSNTGAAASAAANSTVSPPTKMRTLTLRAKWKRQPACYSKQYPNADEVEKRRNNVISIFKDKTPVECFEQLLDRTLSEI